MEVKQLLITNVHILDGISVDINGWLSCEDGLISNYGVGQPPSQFLKPATVLIDGAGLTLMPGFLDIHVHGAMGYEAMDANPDGLITMAHYYAKHGVTGFLPTTWAADLELLYPVLIAIKNLMNKTTGGALILGAHLEGPYINPGKAGAQNPEFIQTPQMFEVIKLLDLEVIKVITLAPEIPANEWLIHECVRRGITISAGHTSATFEEMVKASEQGVTQVTHTFNAMTGLHHREPGTVGAALSLEPLSCELIADGIHVHPAILNLVYKAKGPDRFILVTDAMRGTGLPDGEYPVDDRVITIIDGAARLPGGQLAGSTLTMDKALKNMANATGAHLKDLLPSLTSNPARSLGLANRKGSIAIGMDADLVLVNDHLDVKMTIVNGILIYST